MKNDWKLIGECLPEKSGEYVCTCFKIINEEICRFLRIFYYNTNSNIWSNPDNGEKISLFILAWKSMDVCDVKFNFREFT